LVFNARDIHEEKRIITNLISQFKRRDFMPIVAAFALGLSIGDKVSPWLIDNLLPSISILAVWQNSPQFEWQSRLVTGLLFLAVMALVVRKVG
jgi:hypothetical protein